MLVAVAIYGLIGFTQAQGSDTLVVYTNSDSDGRGEWLTEQAQEAGLNIQIVGAGGGDLTNKLIAEKNNPIADVVFGLNNMYFEQLKAEDTLVPYEPTWSGEIDASMADQGEEPMYWPIVEQGIVLVYDADKYTEETAPQDWLDLWTKPEFEGRYESVTSLGGATTQLVFAGILNRYKDESGDLGVSDEGWAQVEAYFANGSPAETDVDLFVRIAEGAVDMGQIWTSGIPAREEEYGVDVAVMTPEVGVPYAVEQVGIVKGSEKQELAEEFINWFGAAEVQGAWSQEFSSVPANQNALEQAPQDILEIHENLAPQAIDWTFTQEHMGEWIEKIELQYIY